MGWDTVDEVKARLAGFDTRIVPGVAFVHHRLEGRRDGSRWLAWRAQGDVAYFLGYRPSYLVAKTVFRASREASALAILQGYAVSALRRSPRVSDRRVIDLLRRQQRLRAMRQRAGEALGRRLKPAPNP
jgi:hypothetical protein